MTNGNQGGTDQGHRVAQRQLKCLRNVAIGFRRARYVANCNTNRTPRFRFPDRSHQLLASMRTKTRGWEWMTCHQAEDFQPLLRIRTW
ncbi:hypothetical protein SynRS9909_02188 [Synechococcus sp. RS9909]|nr:hypothetical protein SynRS9909_02188 [Synechococcus sp. RS9909]